MEREREMGCSRRITDFFYLHLGPHVEEILCIKSRPINKISII